LGQEIRDGRFDQARIAVAGVLDEELFGASGT